jgi:2-hydroxy-3-keto-5-methylthiopentenyl-1-phosphate phosphatase
LPVAANHLVQCGPRRWMLEFPHTRSDCRSASGTCKCAWTSAPLASAGTRVLMIGDGASDFCVAGRATLNFASKRLLDHCLDHGLPHRAVANFKQALDLWPELISPPVSDRSLQLPC